MNNTNFVINNNERYCKKKLQCENENNHVFVETCK